MLLVNESTRGVREGALCFADAEPLVVHADTTKSDYKFCYWYATVPCKLCDCHSWRQDEDETKSKVDTR